MKQISPPVLTAGISGSAILLSLGHLFIVNSLQNNNLNTAIMHLVCGISVALATYFCGIERLLKAAPYIMGLELILLLLCLILGCNINGASRWLRFGTYYFAPAMLSIPIICLFWTYIKKKSADGISRNKWLLLWLVILLSAGFVLFEPFYSMSVLIIITTTLILPIIAGCGWKKTVLAATGTVIVGAALVPIIIKQHQLAGLKDFYCNFLAPNSETQYHTWSLFTTLKHSVFCGHHNVPAELKYHISNAISDSALIAGCGEFGFVFLIAALLLILIIIVCGITIARRCQNPVNVLLAGGMTAALSLPALANIFMMFGLFPAGGIAFPFLSYGGSAMIANFFSLACLLLASRFEQIQE